MLFMFKSTRGKCVLGIKYVFPFFSLQLLFETFFTPMTI